MPLHLAFGHNYYDDIQGNLQSALVGATSYTFRQYRSTGLVYPHIAENDIFSMTFQLPHRKKLLTNLDSVHLHLIPIASANGNVKINYSWGWYNRETTIPDTLPNSSSQSIAFVTGDQYKLKITNLVANCAYPEGEAYSSILMIKCQRVAPDSDNWGGVK